MAETQALTLLIWAPGVVWAVMGLLFGIAHVIDQFNGEA